MTQSPTPLPAEALTDEYVVVRRDAIEWLKKQYPALCEKSGLCERVGGRLYTRTTQCAPGILAANTPVAQPAGAVPERMAPVQGYQRGIPWSMHLDAYDAYCKKYGKQKALIEGGCRGGFGTGELDMFIPGWRDKVSEMGKLKERVAELEAALNAAPTRHPRPVGAGKAPERIWLIDYQDDHEGTLWCQDSVGDADIEYVRADLAAPTHSPMPNLDGDWSPISETLIKRLRDPIPAQALIDMPERMAEAINVISNEAADAIESLAGQCREMEYLAECAANRDKAADPTQVPENSGGDGWQPIKTAPLDGREVLLTVESRAGVSCCQLVGHYMPGGHCIEDHPPIGSGWYFWTGAMFDCASKPTHWMPLPAAPSPEPATRADGAKS